LAASFSHNAQTAPFHTVLLISGFVWLRWIAHILLPYRKITAASTTHLTKEKLLVVYCWSPGCNAATKAAARLSALGFQVKEMLGGIEYWRREGGLVEGTLGEQAPLVR